MATVRITGKIQRVPRDKVTQQLKGFGFLRDARDRDFFFHYTELKDGLRLENLEPDQVLTFTAVNTPQGWRATEIRPATPTLRGEDCDGTDDE